MDGSQEVPVTVDLGLGQMARLVVQEAARTVNQVNSEPPTIQSPASDQRDLLGSAELELRDDVNDGRHRGTHRW